MTPDVTLAAMVLIPVAALVALRINAALVFLSLTLGSVLVQFVAPDADSFLALFSASVPEGVGGGNDTVKIVLLLSPVVLTAIFMIRTVSGYSRLALNVLPAMGVGLLASLLVVPLLPPNLSSSILDSSLWAEVQRTQNLIVGVSSLVCLFVLWLQRPHAGHKKHGKHKG